MLDLPLWSWAPLIGGIYLAVAWVTNDLFPFSRYAMYSSAVNRSAGAIPVFQADEAFADLIDFTDFTGLEPAGFYPPRTPCSLEWMVHEAERYVTQHASEGEPGPIRVVWGFLYIQVDNDGSVTERLEVVQRGYAHRRS